MKDQPAPATRDSAVGRLVERWLPGGARAVTEQRRLTVVALVITVVVAAAIVTAIVLSNRQPMAESAPALPPAVNADPAQTTTAQPAPSWLVVSVVGRVARPGLVTLPGGARVADAVQAAGGVLPGTNDTTLNLARRLSDGEQIYVGIPAPANDTAGDNGDGDNADDGSASSAAPAMVDINTASETELETLPGIGPTMAQRILTWRGQHGHFDSISQLRDVQGIGPGRYAKIAKLVTT